MSFPLINPKPTFSDTNGVPLVNGSLTITDPATAALKASYPTADDAEALTNANTNPIVLNARGEAPAGIFLVDGQTYKVELKNEAGTQAWIVDDIESGVSGLGASGIGITDTGGNYNATNVEAALAELASASSGEGASIIKIEDAAANFTATEVEAALAEVWTNFASTSTGQGASKIGVEDSVGFFTGTQVEAVLLEMMRELGEVKTKTIDEQAISDSTLSVDTHLNGWAVNALKKYRIDGFIKYTQNIGDIKMKFDTAGATANAAVLYYVTDTNGIRDEFFVNALDTEVSINTTTNNLDVGLMIKGFFESNSNQNVDFWWAQVGAHANPTTLYEGSWIRIGRVEK